MTYRAIVRPTSAVHVCWKDSLIKLEVGEKPLVRGRTQASIGAAISNFNKDGKRFVSKLNKTGVYVIRVL